MNKLTIGDLSSSLAVKLPLRLPFVHTLSRHSSKDTVSKAVCECGSYIAGIAETHRCWC